MTNIDREQLKRMMLKDVATIVEVLDERQFGKGHLPGAFNVPLNDDFDDVIQDVVPDKTQPVIVYCLDADCDASPKAARRMDELGYQRVYDYAGGKSDWTEAGLPVERQVSTDALDG